MPKFDHEKDPLPLFDVDDELANFAVSTLKKTKVDIRHLKRQRTVVDEAICQKIDQQGNLYLYIYPTSINYIHKPI